LKYIYKIFSAALDLLADDGLITVSVCSRDLTDASLNQTLLNASAEKKVSLRIVYENGLSADHPVMLNFPEGAYLKCLGLKKVFSK